MCFPLRSSTYLGRFCKTFCFNLKKSLCMFQTVLKLLFYFWDNTGVSLTVEIKNQETKVKENDTVNWKGEAYFKNDWILLVSKILRSFFCMNFHLLKVFHPLSSLSQILQEDVMLANDPSASLTWTRPILPVSQSIIQFFVIFLSFHVIYHVKQGDKNMLLQGLKWFLLYFLIQIWVIWNQQINICLTSLYKQSVPKS